DEDLLIDPAMSPELRLLRTQQQNAIKALAEGVAVGRAAARAGVGRSTLYRWMKTDQAFINALRTWRARARRDVRDRLLAIATQASSNLQESVRYGNLGVSLAVLRGLGFLAPRPAPRRAKAAPASASAHGPTSDAGNKLI